MLFKEELKKKTVELMITYTLTFIFKIKVVGTSIILSLKIFDALLKILRSDNAIFLKNFSILKY